MMPSFESLGNCSITGTCFYSTKPLLSKSEAKQTACFFCVRQTGRVDVLAHIETIPGTHPRAERLNSLSRYTGNLPFPRVYPPVAEPSRPAFHQRRRKDGCRESENPDQCLASSSIQANIRSKQKICMLFMPLLRCASIVISNLGPLDVAAIVRCPACS